MGIVNFSPAVASAVLVELSVSAIAKLPLEIWLHRSQFYQRVEPFVVLSRVGPLD